MTLGYLSQLIAEIHTIFVLIFENNSTFVAAIICR